MSLDIQSILDDWPYEPGQVTARRIRGQDGREKIQMRLDLGLLQMEVVGRPDGQRPHSHDSLLAWYEHLLQRHREDFGDETAFKLDEQACELLRAESVLYYHRYLAEFILEDFAAVERDTMRNLRVMDFCSKYGGEESDRFAMEQYRPYVLMMCTRARARLAMEQNRFKAALAAVRIGMAKIKEFYARYGQEDVAGESSEIAVLKAMAKEVEARIPIDPIQKLRSDLAKAVKDERYEDAAHLRDQLRQAPPDAHRDPPAEKRSDELDKDEKGG